MTSAVKITALAAAASLLSITPASAAIVEWTVASGGNGHFYELSASTANFDTALAAAASQAYLGLQGYLATITSAGEQSFFSTITNSAAWVSGSDREVEGTWKWLAGPEAGQTFWANGATVTYANWSGGEPNNQANEDYVWANWSGPKWNDAQPHPSLLYVVEYGGLRVTEPPGIPEPATWTMMIMGFGLAGGAMRSARRRRAAA